MELRKQACAPPTRPFGAEAFEKVQGTVIRWLGNAGELINCRGTCIMMDPLLVGFDMPLLIEMPVSPEAVAGLDAVLITHCDNDHYDPDTCRALAGTGAAYHSTQYVAELITEEGMPAYGHAIGDTFQVGPVRITLTPADHAWQNELPDAKRTYRFEEYCGFWLETPDGALWAPGDSRLLPEHLQMPEPDALFFDFSDNAWHIGLDNAVKLANTYPRTPLLLYHWGSVDAPDMDAFNADPARLADRVANPGRICILAPGEPYSLCRLPGGK